MRKIFIILPFLMLLLAACTKKDQLEQTRLFRPVIKGALVSEGNWISASWQAIKGADSYTVEISKDTFQTIVASMNVDTSTAIFENLEWNKLYQVQVRAIAHDTAFNSRMSFLGAIKTPVFPTILNTPSVSEISDNAVKVSWTTGGAEVTSIKILKGSDSSVVTEVTLTPADVSAQFKIISGLNASTPYIIYLYSGASLRGWADFTTLAPFSGNLIDLRGITGRPSVLLDTLPVIPSGSTIILKRGEDYTISSSYSLDKSVLITSGRDLLIPDQAIITLPSNFNIVSGSNIDSIVFRDVSLIGTAYSSKYVFNINTACTIGKLKFENCRGQIFRGLVRTQSQPVMINNFEVNNCILDSLAGYGVITCDVATSVVDNIRITNSTIYKAEKIITSKSAASSVTIDNCTFNETPNGGGSNYVVDYNGFDVSGGITISNSIFGIGKWNNGATTTKDIRSGASTVINANHNYRTSDHSSLGNDIPNIITYTLPTTQLFQDPSNGNFKIIDNGFPGRSDSGDPRWYY